MFEGERLQPVQRAFLPERRGVAFEGEWGVEDAGAAAAGFLALHGMGGAVGAEEEFGRSRSRGAAHRQAMLLALGDGQAISMGPEAAGEQRVAVDRSEERRV